MSDIGTGRGGGISKSGEIQATSSVTRSGTPLPPAIAKLPLGSVLTGTVVSRDGRGLTLIDTPQGKLSVKADPSLLKYLSKGAEVLIRLEAPPTLASAHAAQAGVKPPPATRILTINGTPISKLTAEQKPDPGVIVKQSTQSIAKEAGTPLSKDTGAPPPRTSAPYGHLKPPTSPTGQATQAQATAQPRSALLAGTVITLSAENLSPRQIQALIPLAPALQSVPAKTLQHLLQSGVQLQARVITSQRPALPTPVAPGTTAAPSAPASTAASAPTTTTPSNLTPSPAQTVSPTNATSVPSPASATTSGQTPPTMPPATSQPTQPTGQSATSPTPAQASTAPPSAAPSTGTTAPSAAPPTTSAPPPSVTPAAAAGAFTHTTEGFNLRGVVQYLHSQPAQTQTPGAQPNPVIPSAAQNTRIPLSPGQTPTTPGIMVLDTPIGSFRLPPGMPHLPAGSAITLDILQARPAGQAALAATTGPHSPLPVESRPPAPLPELAIRWETLEEAVRHAQTLPTDGGARLLLDSLPQPTTRLATSTLFFLSALGMNNMTHWLGSEAVNMLQATRPKLLQKLEQEFASVRQLFADSAQQPWQVALMPMLDEDKVHPIAFYFKRGQGGKGEKEEGGQDRFVVEVNLSQFGPMQFDGLFRQQPQAATPEAKPQKHLALLVRTHSPLPGEVRQHIGELFYNIAENLRMEGHIAFDITPNFPDVSRETLLQRAISDVEV